MFQFLLKNRTGSSLPIFAKHKFLFKTSQLFLIIEHINKIIMILQSDNFFKFVKQFSVHTVDVMPGRYHHGFTWAVTIGRFINCQ